VTTVTTILNLIFNSNPPDGWHPAGNAPPMGDMPTIG